jgi:hypothetical protein
VCKEINVRIEIAKFETDEMIRRWSPNIEQDIFDKTNTKLNFLKYNESQELILQLSGLPNGIICALFEISDEIASCVDLNFESFKSVFDLLNMIEKVFLNFYKKYLLKN